MTGWSLFLALLALSFIVIYLPPRAWRSFENGVGDGLAVAALILMLSAVPAMIAYGIIGAVTGDQVKGGERALVALSTGAETEGRFFLGSGQIGEKPVYTYMYPSEGGARMSTVDADKTVVYEIDDDTAPRIEVWHKQSDITPDISFVKSNLWVSGATLYQVYVPEGSIWQGYSVDVRNSS